MSSTQVVHHHHHHTISDAQFKKQLHRHRKRKSLFSPIRSAWKYTISLPVVSTVWRIFKLILAVWLMWTVMYVNPQDDWLWGVSDSCDLIVEERGVVGAVHDVSAVAGDVFAGEPPSTDAIKSWLETTTDSLAEISVTAERAFNGAPAPVETVEAPGTVPIGSGCVPCPTGDGGTLLVAGIDPKLPQVTEEQYANAATIVSVGQSRGVPEYGLIVALAASLQESQLYNLDYGDSDSVGLFQQRTSAGWGTIDQIMDPTYSATAFFGGPDVPPANPGLLDIAGWMTMSVTDAAQAVQRSAYPDAYADDEPLARELVAALAADTPFVPTVGCDPGGIVPVGTDPNAPGPVTWALGHLGIPYLWAGCYDGVPSCYGGDGGSGPEQRDQADCSGFTSAAWWFGAQVDIGRTARDQIVDDNVAPVAAGQEQAGDLAFSEFATDGPHHVALVVTPGTIVEAARSGTSTRTRAYGPGDFQFYRVYPDSQA